MTLDHIAEQDLEAYSMGRLDVEAAAPVEEHLLICDHCQGRLVEWDRYCRAIRAASRLLKARRAAPPVRLRSDTASGA